MRDWIAGSWSDALMIVVSFVCVYLAILIYVRVVGLRSFSKVTAGDFVITLAVGSLLASSISSQSPPIAMTLVALACLLGGQWLYAWLRRSSPLLRGALENEPIVLMVNSNILHDNLRKANISETDLMEKLREANVLRLQDVRAVVFETTGDFSILHSTDRQAVIDPRVMLGVRDVELLPDIAAEAPVSSNERA